MKKHLLAISLILLGALDSRAVLTFYTSEAVFDAAASGVAVQNFSAAAVAPNSIQVMSNPLNSATNNGIFATGAILPGLSLSATGSHVGQDLAITGVGFNGLSNKAVFANFLIETLNLNFASGVTAVGLGLVSIGQSDFTLSFFSPTNTLIGTTTVNGVPEFGSGLFFGVTANGGDVIGRINLSSNSGQNEGVDRVKFGAAAAPVPEPHTPLVGVMVLGVCAVAAFFRLRSEATIR